MRDAISETRQAEIGHNATVTAETQHGSSPAAASRNILPKIGRARGGIRA